MSTLGTSRVHTAEVAMASTGAWRADVVLEDGAAPALGPAKLTIGDLVLSGTVQRSGLDAPDRPHAVLVAGAGGWDGLVQSPISFQSDLGVRLSTVLAALSAGAGETIEQPADAVLGEYFECLASRPAEPVHYRDALNEMVRAGAISGWRVDPDGVTRFGARAGVAATSRATQLRRNAGLGCTTYGIDSPTAFLPGNTLDGVAIARVTIRETGSKLEADVWPVTSIPPIRTMVQQMVAALLGDVVRTYLVAAVRPDKRLDLVPPPDAPHLPEMAAVEQWSLGGALVTPTVGAEVLVAFRDYPRRTRPVVFAFGPGKPDEDMVDATAIKLGAGASAGAARIGDTVDAGTLTATPIPGQPPPGVLITYTPPGGGAPSIIELFSPTLSTLPTPPVPVIGRILTGSSKTVIE